MAKRSARWSHGSIRPACANADPCRPSIKIPAIFPTDMTFEEVDFGLPPEALFASVHDRRGSFFLDSGLSVGGLGAYSFIGFDPFLVFRARGREITLTYDHGRVETLHGDPLDE